MTNGEFEQLLSKAGLTQVEFSRKVDLGKVTVTRWKQGETYPAWVRGWIEGYIAKNKIDSLVNSLDDLKS